MSDPDKAKSYSARLWKSLVAERSAARVDRREARNFLVSWIDRELEAHAMRAAARGPVPPPSRRIQFLL